MNRHLVAIKVGVERRADQRMQLDGPTINQLWFECLDTQTVQGRCPVQHDWMTVNHLLEHLHDLIISALNQLFGRLDVVDDVLTDQTMNHERLKQLDCHLLGKTALVHLQLRSNHNHGTSGVIDALAEEVLTETPLLAFDDVAQ